ncbi:aminotransferase class I/II-fold pyridoxal phosphate-dependent enzyme [Rhizobium sp. KVB221]|uniref:Aminotransferase class I/II-fold pyridoxal phosphate-dependent enzyme n=1 Tax=Rhizobium setariae TaxID=2801340 RepID=A0A936YWU0_9HYPH|nr:aminotransferase class I/II-fold pyridoxal phosphate-dependent enzyme [Rhizobium setariae]MBL0375462.1 aminotransferase class I/II-fold pyridoxal phosphate-dependent enzyme [Rhizobium setariae]
MRDTSPGPDRQKNRLTGVSSIVTSSRDTPLHSHVPPIFQTSTFSFPSTDAALRAFGGEDNESFVYSRGRNPNAEDLARKLSWLEARDLMAETGADSVDTVAAGRIFSSGMGAISALLSSQLSMGDVVLSQASLYGGTFSFMKEICPRMGVEVRFVSSFLPEDWVRALEMHPKAKLVYIETPSNPTMEIHDIRALADIAHAAGARLAVDNTFATPYLQQPLSLGADYVVHSLTKFISGHGATIGGAVISRRPEEVSLYSHFWKHAIELGASPSPFDCWLTDMGLKTLELRMMRHSANALAIAQLLDGHPKVDSVSYPGLAAHPQHDLARAQMRGGFGGLLTFELKDGLAGSKRFMDSLSIPSIAISLGSVDSLVQCPALMTHSNMSREDQRAAGISDGQIRLSVGIESIEDLATDILQALDRA